MPKYERVVCGNLVTPSKRLVGAWIAIADGRIAALGQGDPPDASHIENAGRAWILPGAIDGQVHAGSHLGLAGLEATTRSAVAGGITTIVDMPYDAPDPVTSVAALEAKIDAIHKYAHCDVALYATVAKEQTTKELTRLASKGICALKISAFENHPVRFPRIPADQTLEILEVAADLGLPVGLHNEDQEIIRARINSLKHLGRTGPEWHSFSRPVAAELAATVHFLELGAATRARVHIVHLSVPRGYDLVARYRNDGVAATAEICLHYLIFDEANDILRLGAKLKVNPPIRAGMRDALWQRLEEGKIEFVSSDHGSWPIESKTAASIFDAGAGVPGLETLVPVFYTALNLRSSRALEDVAFYLSEKPAKFFGLWPRKGALMVGADADLMLLEPRRWTYDSNHAHDGLNWSPYDGQALEACVVAAYVRGKLAWNGEAVTARPGEGRYLRRN